MSLSQAEIYKWVDEHGETHYGDRPIENSEELNVNTDNTGNRKSISNRKERQKKLLDSMEEDRNRKQEEASRQKKNKENHKRRCAIAKDRLKGYERAGYLYGIDKNGKKVVRSNEERQQATDKLRKQIKKHCK